MILFTPLEQFQVLSFFSLNLFYLDFSVTNIILVTVLILIFFCLFIWLLSSYDQTFYVIPNNWQVLLEILFDMISQLLFDNLNKKVKFISRLY